VTSTFYAVTDKGEVLAESSPFRWRKAAPPPDRPAARSAHDEVVAALTESGWTIEARGSGNWFETWFSRPGPAVPEVSVAAPEDVRVAQPAVTQEPSRPEPSAALARRPAPGAGAPVEEETAPVVAPAAPRAVDAPRRPRRRRIAIGFAAAAVAAVAVAAVPASRYVDNLRAPTAQESRTAKHVPSAASEVPSARETRAVARRGARKTVDVRIRAHGNGSWIEIRRGSSSGEVLYAGVLSGGHGLHFRSRRLWTRFGAAANLSVVVDGDSVPLQGTLEKLFVPERR
jgi:hypothetical protein